VALPSESARLKGRAAKGGKLASTRKNRAQMKANLYHDHVRPTHVASGFVVTGPDELSGMNASFS